MFPHRLAPFITKDRLKSHIGPQTAMGFRELNRPYIKNCGRGSQGAVTTGEPNANALFLAVGLSGPPSSPPGCPPRSSRRPSLLQPSTRRWCQWPRPPPTSRSRPRPCRRGGPWRMLGALCVPGWLAGWRAAGSAKALPL